jgi:RNA-binding protein
MQKASQNESAQPCHIAEAAAQQGRQMGCLSSGYNQTMPVTLSPRERAHLKARAHALEPKVMVGHGGVTAAVIAEVDRALTAHELIKVKILGDDRDAREAIGNQLCSGTGAAPVQRVGKVIVLWRPKPEEDAF